MIESVRGIIISCRIRKVALFSMFGIELAREYFSESDTDSDFLTWAKEVVNETRKRAKNSAEEAEYLRIAGWFCLIEMRIYDLS